MAQTLIIGGGLSGLVAAYTLSQNGFNTVLLEKEADLGGLASSYCIKDSFVPKTYHHIMYGDQTVLKIIKELGLEQDLYWKKLKVGFYSEKKFYDFSSPLSILNFKPIKFSGRVKFGLLVLRARRKTDWKDLDGKNVKEYVTENFGKEAYKLVNYIVQAKFAEPADNVSAAWLMSRFGHESKSVSSKFGYLKGGIQSIIDGLSKKCIERDCVIKTGAEVKAISVKDQRINKVMYEAKGTRREMKPEAVVSTIPPPVLAQILDGDSGEYVECLEKIRYKASLCATIALNKRISPFYWLNIMDTDKYPFVGVFEHKHLNHMLKVPSIMYVVKYLNVSDAFWQKNDEEIVDQFLNDLSNLFEEDIESQLLWWRLHRAPYSTPLYTPSYANYMPSVESPIRGLNIAGISRTYPRDRYMGTALLTGLQAANHILMQKEQNGGPAVNLSSVENNQEKYDALVSVIIPAYNGERTISSSVKSVLNQSYKPLELIIIDDASKDDTYQKLCTLQKELNIDFLKVLKHEKNLGLAATLNHGIRESNGKYILILHQDCELIGDDWLTKSLEFFKDNRIAVVTGYYGIPPERTSFIVRAFGVLRKQYYVPPGTRAVEETFSEGKCDIYRRDVLEKTHGFSERYRIAGEDLILSYKVRHEGYIILKGYDLPVLQRFGQGATSLRGNFKKEFIFGKAMGGVFAQFKFFVFRGLTASPYSKSRSLHRAGQPLFIALLLLLLILSAVTQNQLVFFLTIVALILRFLYYGLRTFEEHRRIFNTENSVKRSFEELVTPILGLATDFFYTLGFGYGLILYYFGKRM